MSRVTRPRAATSQERKLRQFEVLARVSSVINSTLEPKEVLNRVLDEAVRVMQATSGLLVFIDPHTQLLQIEVAIGQKIVEAHRGKLEVKSAPKKGTTFRVLLPV